MLAIGLAMAVLLSLPKRAPGYMDAYYHVVIAQRIANGEGFTEPFVWNFLQPPDGIPHPSHLYWSPLPSILAAGSIFLFGDSYAASSLPFVLCAALLPWMTFLLARRIGASEKEAAVSGVLTLLAGFYAAHWSSPDSFAPFALAGCASLVFIASADRGRWYAMAAGLFAGLGHLARPDGMLLAATGLLWIAWLGVRRNADRKAALRAGLWLTAGYFAVMAPWYARTWAAAGSPLAGGGLRALWLRSYDELYAALRLANPGDYLAWGWGNILESKGSALLSNLVTLAGGLLFVMAPLAVWGWWANRRNPLLPPMAIHGGLLYLSMSLAFTFPGPRGSFFHSAGALLPFGFAAAFPGLRAAVAWFSARRERWDPQQAYRVFSVGFVTLSLMVGGLLYARGLGARPPLLAAWNQRDAVYAEAAQWLAGNAAPTDRVMVNDPPGFHYFTGRECVAIPSDGLDALRVVREKYNARWLLVEHHHPAWLNAVYNGAPLPGWTSRHTFYDSTLGKAILYEWDEAR
jgi:hypothetical protein